MDKEHEGLRIFYDVDTQRDFMNRDGALYVPGAEEIKPNLRSLTKYAHFWKIPIMGSVDRHIGTERYRNREIELKRWGGPFPNHCMKGTEGEKKISDTLEEMPMRNELVEQGCYSTEPENSIMRISHLSDGAEEQIDWANSVVEAVRNYSFFRKYGDKFKPIFFEKQSYDVFTNPAFAAYLEKAYVKEAVVYGVATDYCVKAAVVGMQEKGIQCYVVTDAIAAVTPETGKSALEEMVNAGAKLVKIKDVLDNKMKW